MQSHADTHTVIGRRGKKRKGERKRERIRERKSTSEREKGGKRVGNVGGGERVRE